MMSRLIYKIDFNGTNFTMIEKVVENSKELETNLADNLGYYTDEQRAYVAMTHYNCRLVDSFDDIVDEDKLIVRVCKDCKKFFILTYGEYDWFAQGHLNIPCRCKECRTKRRITK